MVCPVRSGDGKGRGARQWAATLGHLRVPASPGRGALREQRGRGGGLGSFLPSLCSLCRPGSLRVPLRDSGFHSGLPGPPPMPRDVQLRCHPFPVGAGWTYSNENLARMTSFHTTVASALFTASSRLLALAGQLPAVSRPRGGTLRPLCPQPGGAESRHSLLVGRGVTAAPAT